ncbi:MAG: ABC transporter ATP-binding protein [Rhodobacteraceae bacterium]|nr:ABC transporter ATP-binding protein [Paracoccaceae bacterium]
MTATPAVSVDSLRVEFPTKGGSFVAVKDVRFEIMPGEILGVVGESGSGKSVTSAALLQLTKFSAGRVVAGSMRLVRGDGSIVDLRRSDERRMRNVRGNEIGMIFQEPVIALNPAYTIGWQLSEGLRIHKGLSGKEANASALELLQKVRISNPKRRLKQYPHELSGGMCQRVVIAMALACEPRVLIADEPTTSLDVTVQAEILSLIALLRKETGAAVLLITHDMAVVAQMADRVVVMYRGEVVEEGSVRQILHHPRHSYTRALLAAVPKIGEMTGTDGPKRMKIASQSGKEFSPAVASEEPLLEVRELTKRFPVRGGILRRVVANVHAVECVSFGVNRNETLALVGESGSGKSTVGRCILRLEEPDSGELTFEGQNLLTLSRAGMRNQRRHMQIIFQDPYGSLNPQMRLLDQVAEPIRNYRLDKGTAVEDRVASLFDRVGMPRSFLRRYPSELSGGQRQRVAIARSLALNPKFIVADEAVSSLDVSIQAQVLNLMMELQADLGLSYLFISHDMAVVERVSHRVAVMYQGRIVEIGPRASVFGSPGHQYTKTLLAAVPRMDPDVSFADIEVQARALPSPIRSVDHQPSSSRYREILPGHFLLRNDLY